MSVQATYKDTMNLVLTIQVAPDDYKPQVDKELKAYAKKANIPGFRPGTAPIGMIKRMAGKGIVLDAVSKVISDNLYDYIKDNNLDVLGRPLPTKLIGEENVSTDCKETVELDFEIGLAPNFELTLTPEAPLTHYSIDVDDAYLADRMDYLRRQYGEMSQGEEVAENDWIFGKLETVDAEGNAVEGGVSKLISINPEKITGKPEVFAPFLGKKVDDVTTFDVFAISEDVEVLKQQFMLSDEEIEKLKGAANKFTIKRITRTSPAELNPEFFKKILNRDGVEDEETFKEELRKEFTIVLGGEESNRFFNVMQETLIKINKVELPDEFLKKWILAEEESKAEGKSENKITSENIEEAYTQYRRNFQWEMIEGKLQRQEPTLLPDVAQLDEGIYEAIDRASMQNPALGDREILFKQLKKDKDFVERLYNNLKEKNLRDYLESSVPHAHTHITASEFVKLEA